MTSKDIQTLLDQYEAAAVRHSSEKAAPAANAAAEEISAIYQQLRGCSAVENLLPLLKHPNASVRCWAAAHTLEFAPGKAIAVLEALAAGTPGAMRATASMTLREWRAGRLRFPQTLSLPDPGESWGALLDDLGQGFLDAVPGGYFMGESQLAWQGGNYFSNGLLFVGAFADALMSAVTGGESTALLNTLRTGWIARRWVTATSRALVPYYPTANGFIGGGGTRTTLQAGQIINRYGGTAVSRFFSPAGTPLAARSLPPSTASQALRTYEVVRPFEVEAGRVAPAFGQPGLGTQYRSSMSLSELSEQGFVREVGQ